MRIALALCLGSALLGCGSTAPDDDVIFPSFGRAVVIPSTGATIALTNPAFSPMNGGGAVPGTAIPLQLPSNNSRFTLALDAAAQLTPTAAALVNGGGNIDADTYSVEVTALIVYTEDPRNPTASPVVVGPDLSTLEYTITKGLDPSVLPLWHADEALSRQVTADMVFFALRVTPK